MPVPAPAVILHAVLFVAIVVGYTVLTALGHDGNALLGLLVGQAAGAGIQAGTEPVARV